MCGISGFVDNSNLGLVNMELLHKSCEAIFHRGPDSGGTYQKDNVFYGMRRLKIIDLNTGDQPIFNEDRSIFVVFNGEIYNFQELRHSLLQKGHLFSTKTDTEVIVHAYEEYGLDFVKHFRGMFAFALWDSRKQRAVLARDHLGIKPLHYVFNNNVLSFSSEIKGLLVAPFISKEIDLEAMNAYFTFSYVPSPKTIFKGINKLEPGHMIVFENNKVDIRKYWDIEYNNSLQTLPESHYVDVVIDSLQEAIKLQMISDVPLGALLSGGVDSSLVVAIMSQLSSQPVNTFTIGYNDKVFDERRYAQIVSRVYGTNHHEIILQPTNIGELINEVVVSFDEPFSNPSTLPNYLISKEIKKHVTVVLSGLGGDEICAGYERYLGGMMAEKISRLPSSMLKIAARFADKIQDSKNGGQTASRIKRFVHSASLPLLSRYYGFVAKMSDTERNVLLGNLFNSEVSRQVFDDIYAKTGSTLNDMLSVDMKTYLPNELLTLTDRMTSAHALEARVPLIDHHVVELMATIPDNLKIARFNKKYLLKKVAERFIPKDVIYRKKAGFSIPLSKWLREDIKQYVSDLLSEKTLKQVGYFNTSFVTQLLNEHQTYKANHSEKLWALVNFVIWHQRYIG